MGNLEFDDFEYEEQPEEQARRGGINGLLDKVQGLTSNKLVVPVAAFLVGLLLGWMVIGWGLWPVAWKNAAPEQLHQDYKLDYMRMVIDSFNLRQDLPLAQRRVEALGDSGPVVLQNLVDSPGDPVNQLALQIFLQQYNTVSPQPVGTPGPTDIVQEPGEQPASSSRTSSLLLMACAVTAVLAAALFLFWFLKVRNRKPAGKTRAMRAQEFSRQAPQTDYEALGQEAPIAQWMTTYLGGDDLYDDSFSIDSLTGEFLGECGVGIADTIGVGEPKRVSAFEIWLFDKNDIQTVTKLLMSSHAYNDENIHNRLAAKGEPFLALPDSEIVLETKTLQMVIRVMDMDYGTGHLPENSFFQRITLELAVWNK